MSSLVGSVLEACVTEYRLLPISKSATLVQVIGSLEGVDARYFEGVLVLRNQVNCWGLC